MFPCSAVFGCKYTQGPASQAMDIKPSVGEQGAPGRSEDEGPCVAHRHGVLVLWEPGNRVTSGFRGLEMGKDNKIKQLIKGIGAGRLDSG